MKANYSVWSIAMLFTGALIFSAVSGIAFADSSSSTADHSKFAELDKNFESGPQVTLACLSCHTEAAKQVHNTKHWT